VKDSEQLILRAFFEQTRQSFNFFLKLGTCTYLKSFNKTPEPGLFECENFQNLRLRCHNKIQEAPHTWSGGQIQLQLWNYKTSCRQLPMPIGYLCDGLEHIPP